MIDKTAAAVPKNASANTTSDTAFIPGPSETRPAKDCPYVIVLRAAAALEIALPAGQPSAMRRVLVAWLLSVAAIIAGCGNEASCGDGFGEESGQCVATCSTPCGEHEWCTTTSSGGLCACVTGYAGDPCTWTGGLQDPEFTDPEAWPDTTNGATVIALAQGQNDQGIASFESSVVCNAGAVAQTVEMPPYDLAEPFVIEVKYRATKVDGVAVGYNRAFRELPDTVLYPGWQTHRICLGEAGYGGPVKFQVAASGKLADCFSAPEGRIEVDRFAILVAEPGECPAPGEVLNGNAEPGVEGWQFLVELGGEGASSGGVVAGVGNEGSGGARIYKPAGGTNLAAMWTKVSVPRFDTLPSPALSFTVRGVGSQRFLGGLGTFPGLRVTRRPLDMFLADGTASVHTYCLPPWTFGNVLQLYIAMTRSDDEVELVVDDVEVFSDPSCGESLDILDPSFDSAPNRWPGVAIVDPPGVPSSLNGVRLIDDPNRARPPGGGALEVSYTSSQAEVDFHTWVWVPSPDERGYPLLTFYANVPNDPGVRLRWAFFGSISATFQCDDMEGCPTTPINAALREGGDWTRYDDICLPPEWAERWLEFRLTVRPSDGPLEIFDPPRSVLFDDFEVTTDPKCLGF